MFSHGRGKAAAGVGTLADSWVGGDYGSDLHILNTSRTSLIQRRGLNRQTHRNILLLSNEQMKENVFQNVEPFLSYE